MSAPPFMPLYVADYLGDTRHLSTEEHGAYLLLLMAMWRAGGRLPNEGAKLARIVGLTPAKWGKLEADILAFFDVRGDEIGHRRIEKEFEKYTRTTEARSQAGSLGAKAKWLKTQEPAMANAIVSPEQTDSEPQATQNSDIRVEEKEAIASLSPAGDAKGKYPDEFEACWKAYPHIKGRSSKTKALGYWRKIPAETRTRLLAAIERYAANGREPKSDCGAPAMERWLRDCRFEDWLNEAEPTARQLTLKPFPDPEIRNAVITAKGEAWTAAWLDPCAWEAETRMIVPRNGLAAQRLRSEVFRVLQARRASIQTQVTH